MREQPEIYALSIKQLRKMYRDNLDLCAGFAVSSHSGGRLQAF
jgi:hypothetical protein